VHDAFDSFERDRDGGSKGLFAALGRWFR
jgi:hypothetical protein